MSGGDSSVTSFLGALSDAGPAPGGGAAAAIAVAMSGSLGAMAAGLSRRHWPPAPETERECLALRDAALSLSDADARVYAEVVSARRTARRTDAVEGDDALGRALSEAADVPLAIAEIAVRLSALAADLVEEGNPALQGDALTAVLLAAAGTEAAGALVHINLSRWPDDDRHTRVDACITDARRSATQARTALRR